MRNILYYFPLFGFLTAFAAFLIGGLLIITVVGIPPGFGLWQLSKFLILPFSREMIKEDKDSIKENELWNVFGIFVRMVYFPLGLSLALIALVQIAVLYISVIGIPVAKALWRSLPAFFNPAHKICVEREGV